MKYRTLVNVEHDCIKYAPNAEIELSEKEAQELMACKAVEPLLKPYQKPNAAPVAAGSQE